jgi:hypothetical protein
MRLPFTLSGKANRHSCQILGSENPHVLKKHGCDKTKVKVGCAEFEMGPFITVETTRATYVDMLENYAVPQIPQRYFFQQDGAPPHYANILPDFLNEKLQEKWIQREGSIVWPPRLPDSTILDLFSGVHKGHLTKCR